MYIYTHSSDNVKDTRRLSVVSNHLSGDSLTAQELSHPCLNSIVCCTHTQSHAQIHKQSSEDGAQADLQCLGERRNPYGAKSGST